MQSIVDDLKGMLRDAGRDAPSLVVMLVIGLIVAAVVEFVSTIVLALAFAASDGELPSWLLMVPRQLGAVFIHVAVGSIAAAAVRVENGSDARARGWAVVPMASLVNAGMALLAAAFPPVAIGIFAIGSWLVAAAMLDIVVDDSPTGLTAAIVLLRLEPLRCGASLLVSIPFAIVAAAAPGLGGLIMPAAVVFVMLYTLQVYRSHHDLPSDIAAASERTDQRIDGRERRPAYLLDASSIGPDSVEPAATPQATPSPWTAAMLVDGTTIGAWVGGAGDQAIEVDIADLQASRVLLAGADGAWSELVRASPSAWSATLPTPGPWFCLVEGAAPGVTIHWRPLPSTPAQGAA